MRELVEDRDRLEHVKEAIDSILDFARGKSKEELEEDNLKFCYSPGRARYGKPSTGQFRRNAMTHLTLTQPGRDAYDKRNLNNFKIYLIGICLKAKSFLYLQCESGRKFVYMNEDMKTMDKNKEVKRRVFSTISDEDLAAKIAEEKRQNPNEFSSSSQIMHFINSKEILMNTSARGINPMKKWL